VDEKKVEKKIRRGGAIKFMNDRLVSLFRQGMINTENLPPKVQKKLIDNKPMSAKEITATQIEIYSSNKPMTDHWHEIIAQKKKRLQQKTKNEMRINTIYQQQNLDKKIQMQFKRLLYWTTISEKFIYSYRDTRKQRWDFFILVLAFQNSLIIPVQLAFEP
jgi:hypothetical protein